MIITKMALPRRTFLRGVGATLALPFLDAMVPALSARGNAAAQASPRVGFFYLPNGVAMNHTGINYWKPSGEGAAFELSPILTPLAPYRDQMVVISGLSHPNAEGLGDGAGDHSRGTCTWLSGVHPKHTEGSDIRNGTTVDQVIAAEWGSQTALPSLELAIDLNYLVGNCENGYSCAYVNTLAWRTPTTPLPTENNPRVVFERLFGDGGTPAQRLTQMQRRRSLLDSVTDDMARLERGVGPADRARIAEYLDAVRETERRIQKAEESHGDSAAPSSLDRPLGIPERFDEHVRLMFDLVWLAYQGDITRVVTFMFGRELSSRTYPEIGISDPHHGLSHHRDDPGQIAKLAKLNTFQSELFASFLAKMRATPDGDGTLLDHSLLMYGAGLSNPNIHSHVDLPTALLGGASGRLAGNRHMTVPLEAETSRMSNLLLSVMDKAGIHAERFGDSTGPFALDAAGSPMAGL
jgi:hypothetical protein